MPFWPGRPHPLGATWDGLGVNVAIFSEHATSRGGWSWYTGSAGWMYQLILESLLGVRRDGVRLRIAPCLPADWDGFKVHYRYGETVSHITVTRAVDGGSAGLTVDGGDQPDGDIVLVDDRRERTVEVRTACTVG